MTIFKVVSTCDVREAVAVVELRDGNLVAFSRDNNPPVRIEVGITAFVWHLNGIVWDGRQASAAVAHADTGIIYASTQSAVYCIDPDSRNVRLLAGSPTECGSHDGAALLARFYDIQGLCMIGDDILVSDVDGACLKLISIERNTVTTVATLDIEPVPVLNSITYDKSRQVALAADYTAHRILEFQVGSVPYAMRTYAGETHAEGLVDGSLESARFTRPVWLGYDIAGLLIIIANSCIRYIAAGSDSVYTASLVNCIGHREEGFHAVACCITSKGMLAAITNDEVWVIDTQGLVTGTQSKGSMPAQLSTLKSCGHIGDTLWQMQQTGSHCDVQFKVNDELLKAHKLLLIARSEFFATLLADHWGNGAAGAVVDFPETTPKAFAIVLKYLYTDRIEVPYTDLVDVVLLARRLMLFQLEAECSWRLKMSLRDETAVNICILAHVQLLSEELQAAAVKAVVKMRKLLTDEQKAKLAQYPELLVLLFQSA